MTSQEPSVLPSSTKMISNPVLAGSITARDFAMQDRQTLDFVEKGNDNGNHEGSVSAKVALGYLESIFWSSRMESPWARAYYWHFAKYFGKPFDVQSYQSATGIPLKLATYDLRYRKFRVYASIGLADEVSKDVGEVILLSDDFGKDVPDLFVNSLFFILDKDIPLGSRFAVAGVDSLNPDFAEHYNKAAIYYDVADGFDEGFGRVECDGETGLVYQGSIHLRGGIGFSQTQGAGRICRGV